MKEALKKAKRSIISRELPSDSEDIKRLLQFYRDHAKGIHIQNELMTSSDNRFVIKEHGRIRIVYFEELMWAEAFDYYSKLHTIKGTYLIRKPLKEIEKELPNDFIRIHRSFIIRSDQIAEIKKEIYGGTIILKNKHSLKVSGRYWKLIKEGFS